MTSSHLVESEPWWKKVQLSLFWFDFRFGAVLKCRNVPFLRRRRRFPLELVRTRVKLVDWRTGYRNIPVWLLSEAKPKKAWVLVTIKAQNRAPSLANPPPFLSSSLGFLFQINKIHSLVTSLFLISCLIFTSSLFTFPQSGGILGHIVCGGTSSTDFLVTHHLSLIHFFFLLRPTTFLARLAFVCHN